MTAEIFDFVKIKRGRDFAKKHTVEEQMKRVFNLDDGELSPEVSTAVNTILAFERGVQDRIIQDRKRQERIDKVRDLIVEMDLGQDHFSCACGIVQSSHRFSPKPCPGCGDTQLEEI